MNIFNKIGNQIEKEKKEKKVFQNKYWKLSASERMDYDNRLERIKKRKIPLLELTCTMFEVIIIAALFVSFMAFTTSMPIDNLLDLLKSTFLTFIKVLKWVLFLDIIILLRWLVRDDYKKMIKELNKRFKID